MSTDEKSEKDEVTINIGMPRPLHRRLSITCAVLDMSLKAALVAGAALWIDENAHAVARALPPTSHPASGKRPRSKASEDTRPEPAATATRTEVSPDTTEHTERDEVGS
jgi:hypothetical protein